MPVVEVVEVDGVGDAAVVFDAGGSEDFFSRGVIVLIPDDCIIVFFNGSGVEGAAFGIENPLFAFDIAGFLFADEDEESLPINAERVEGHLVVTLSSGGIVGMQFSSGMEGCFLPKAGKVKDAERACDS